MPLIDVWHVRQVIDYVWGPHTTLSFNDSLEVLTEFRKAVMFMVWFITAKGYRLISAKEKGSHSRIQQRLGTSFWPSSPSGVIQTALNSPSNDV